MGLINIDALLKLNRMRDLKVSSNKKNIEICTDPYRVLKETENYKYETVEVSNDVIENIEEVGIIDEIVRMTFNNKKIYNTKEIDEGEYQYWKGTGKKCDGHYLKYNKVSEAEHPFDLYFRICEKVFYKQFESFNENSSEQLYEQDHRSQGRLLAFEYLSGTNLEFNKTFSKNFNLDITNIDDFKLILLDEKLALEVRKYITRCVAIEAKKIAWNGRNQDYILKQKKVNGKLESYSEQIFSFSLDMPLSDDNSCDGHSIVEGVYEDENTELNEFIQDEQENLKHEDNLYKYLLSNIDNILTKKQLLYLRAYLNNEEDAYLSSISENENNQRAYRHNYKKKIREYITKYLDKDLYTVNKNNKYDFKQSILSSLEEILKQNSNKEIFIKLCNTLQNNKNNEIEKILIDLLYELEPKYYTPIVAHINFNSFFDKYIENDFIVVIQALQSAYNWHGKNNIVLYNLNRSNKELIVETKIKSLTNNNKEGYISKSKSDKFMSIKQLREFFEEVEEVKINNKQLKEVLNKYNYDIDLKPTKRNGIEIYFITVLGYKVRKKKVVGKQKRSFDLTIQQSKDIEDYIYTNLKLDKLLNCKKDVEGHLRICDVRSFIENMLFVSRITINELYEILLQSNYLLDLKMGSKQINRTKVSACKIQRVD
ncbi:hypothetical protein QOZ83_15695 [Romboutsia sedimentorum]|uniref:hypothetical protein n=1 Tax=Romboutsia sedimentorum TaxID=1368474 RepID=UPI0024DE5D34|nr:hypothetical protein [Romboutsia sedimentorum]MDK2587290.1 hypothetical protein [Romboutsia sedimentorum]